MMYAFEDDEDDKYEAITHLDRKNNGTEVFSLQDICLLSISQNLLRFNFAFTTTEDSNFRRNLQFLQRCHSSYLIKSAIKYRKKLDESYFDFLLNQHIKEFDMAFLYRCGRGNVIQRMSEIGHGFQKVYFNFQEGSYSEVLDFVNTLVCHLPNVELLNFHGHCNDSTLEIVASCCQQLKELYIDDCFVSNKGLKCLCQENGGNRSGLNLKHLSMSGVFNPDEGIAYLLQNMPSLKVIVYPDLPFILHKMHKDSMNNTSDRKYNLTSLCLETLYWEDTPTINDILNLYTDICPHIKNLSLVFTDKEQLDLCFKFQELEEFSDYNMDYNVTLDINEFLKSKGGILRRLLLEKFTLSVGVLIQNCRKLESLTLKKNITFQHSDSSASMQPLINLQELSLEYFSLSDALIRHSVIDILNSSQKIETLNLKSVKFGNNEEFVTRFSNICENETLKYLTFTSCDVDYAFLLSVLLACSNLKILTVSYCDNITSNHMDNLYEIANSLKRKTKITWYDVSQELYSDDYSDNYCEDEFDTRLSL